MKKDLFGKAILDFQTNNQPEDLITETSISEADVLPVAYLFRTYAEMPELEQKALQLSRGRVLDLGCGAGSHSLYLQEQKKLDVVSCDISPAAIEASQLRGLQQGVCMNYLTDNTEVLGQFDTILLLMNGAGLCGRLSKIGAFLQKLKSQLAPNGQILLDSSDIIYMYDQDEDGSYWIPGDGRYYGELEFHVKYKGEEEAPFPWLYIDYNTLQNAAIANGLHCELLLEGPHFDYLARLQHLA